jgi:hypothetical protein
MLECRPPNKERRSIRSQNQENLVMFGAGRSRAIAFNSGNFAMEAAVLDQLAPRTVNASLRHVGEMAGRSALAHGCWWAFTLAVASALCGGALRPMHARGGDANAAAAEVDREQPKWSSQADVEKH